MRKRKEVRLVSIHDVLTAREALSDLTASRLGVVDDFQEPAFLMPASAGQQIRARLRRPIRRRTYRACARLGAIMTKKSVA